MKELGHCAAAFGLFILVSAPAETALAGDDAPAASLNAASQTFASGVNVLPLDDNALKARGSGASVRRGSDGRATLAQSPDSTLGQFTGPILRVFRTPQAAPPNAAPAVTSGVVASSMSMPLTPP